MLLIGFFFFYFLGVELNERRCDEEASSSNNSQKVEKQQRYKILRKEDAATSGNPLINNFSQLSLNDCNKESKSEAVACFHKLIVDYQKSCVTDNE